MNAVVQRTRRPARGSSTGTVVQRRPVGDNRPMRAAPRLLLGLALTAGAVLGPALPALAAANGIATVKPTAEGWYRTAPVCGIPTGCGALSAAPSQYPPDTLHVGVNSGTEEARTYLQLDLAKLPAGTKPSGGTLLLPLAGSRDGTRAPETAKLRACAVTDEVTDVHGSFAAPPKVDCESASAPAVFVAAQGEDPAAFTVDLAALTAAWEAGAQPGALALLPAEGTAPPQSWHTAFSDRTRTGAGVVPISAALSFVSASVDTSSQAAPAVAPPPFEPAPAPAFASGSGSVDVGPETAFAAPELSAQTPLLPAPVAQAAPAPVPAPVPQQVVPVAQSFVQGGFRYPAVFLLPLLLAIGVGWLGRALTRDLGSTQP